MWVLYYKYNGSLRLAERAAAPRAGCLSGNICLSARVCIIDLRRELSPTVYEKELLL